MSDIQHCVYILECKDGSLYTGYTNNIEKRIGAHQQGKGAKYTRGRTPVELVFLQHFTNKTEAMRAEYQIKRLKRADKQRLIEEKEPIINVETI